MYPLVEQVPVERNGEDGRSAMVRDERELPIWHRATSFGVLDPPGLSAQRRLTSLDHTCYTAPSVAVQCRGERGRPRSRRRDAPW